MNRHEKIYRLCGSCGGLALCGIQPADVLGRAGPLAGDKIADPWYTGNFDETYDDILEGCTAAPGFARRRIHDLRLAMTLKHWGVTDFYTRNVRDFADVGFSELKNPFEM